jgi:hypothetical protein
MTDRKHQYPLRLDASYRLLKPIGGLAVGDVVRIVNIQPYLYGEKLSEYALIVKRQDGENVELIAHLPDGRVSESFEPVRE